MQKISGIYKIINTITNDFYIGSSKNVKRRWNEHKCTSTWKRYPNNPMYIDMKKYGVEKFEFQVIEEVEEGKLKETEQKFIELLNPTYNSIRANGWDIERYKEYEKTDKRKEAQKKYYNQLCCYNGQTLTLAALQMRFKSQGIDHPVIEAKKYLIGGCNENMRSI